jgi:hypothetical protein
VVKVNHGRGSRGGVSVLRMRVFAVAGILAAVTAVGPPTKTVTAVGPGASEPVLSAYLDGKPIPPTDASKYYCDDFSYPVIQCSRSPRLIEARATLVTLLASVDYVTIFDYTTYQGAWMHVSQDYAALLTIGWSDRISSFKGRNYESGRFWTDWFFSGSLWDFCCNQNVSSLGSYNNTFSSMHRT